MLTARYPDDPDEVFRYERLHGRMKQRAREHWLELKRSGRGSRWVQPVVVVWGNFADEILLYDRVAYVAGRRLPDYLCKPEAFTATP